MTHVVRVWTLSLDVSTDSMDSTAFLLRPAINTQLAVIRDLRQPITTDMLLQKINRDAARKRHATGEGL
ncbi:MAG: hypothetical protein KKB02_10020 [Alphaproteobacteria bacterium]|nr:hypothetical protein [Alphaproteobacteria bacterium]